MKKIIAGKKFLNYSKRYNYFRSTYISYRLNIFVQVHKKQSFEIRESFGFPLLYQPTQSDLTS